MQAWPPIFLRLGALLLSIGVVPVLLGLWLWPTDELLIPNLLVLTVAPLGALCLAIAAILFLVGWVRRPR